MTKITAIRSELTCKFEMFTGKNRIIKNQFQFIYYSAFILNKSLQKSFIVFMSFFLLFYNPDKAIFFFEQKQNF